MSRVHMPSNFWTSVCHLGFMSLRNSQSISRVLWLFLYLAVCWLRYAGVCIPFLYIYIFAPQKVSKGS